MEKSKLIQVLKTFSTSELREFKDFVASPFFNKNQELILFYGYIKKNAPSFSLKKIKKEVVYQTVFPNQNYDEKHLKYLMSFLLKLAEEFIGLKKYQSNKIRLKYNILEACIDRKLDKSYADIYRKATKELENHPYRDTNFYFEKHLLAEVGNRYLGKKNVRKFNEKLREIADNFDFYYLGKKLKLTCEMLNQKKFLSGDYHSNMLEELQNYLQKFPYEDVPIITVYLTILKTLTHEDNIAHFEKLKSDLNTYSNLFEVEEMKQIYIHTINYCIRKIRQKEERFVEEALNLYMNGIETKLLFEGDFLSPWTYNNIIKLGLRLGRYDWTETAIKTYHTALEEPFRDSAFNYSLADLYYHKQDFNKALLHLREVEYSDIFFALDAKVMLLKIYFEKSEKEALHSLIISFKTYLKRNKLISNTMRETYLNFTILLAQLDKNQFHPITDLKEKIINSELLVDRKWLLEQLKV
ncbi:MAG: hypothetical protein NXI23_07585 [Bacteroidetes bacterium]|jgi:hypothetical protein|nr:hypothetical protein [Bacteroidota bacterium]MDF1865551.1 hypothetical protein [Saprospiraceae bacterium]